MHITKILGFVGFLSLFSAACVPASAQTGLTKDLSSLTAKTYALEKDHTKILFGVSHLGFTTYYGFFNGSAGSLYFDPGSVAKSTLNVTIPTASIMTGNEKLDGELKSADWLDAAHYPDLKFVSTSVSQTGSDTGTIIGNLTMHGVTKPITLQVKFNGAGANPMSKKETVGFEATGMLKRSDFGVDKYVPMVGDEVALTLSGAFEKAE